MKLYRQERIENAILYFAEEHLKKTKTYLTPLALFKYLSFFEMLILKNRGYLPFELKYQAKETGPFPIDFYDLASCSFFSKVRLEKRVSFEGEENREIFSIKPQGYFEEDYFSEVELKELKFLINVFASQWVDSKIKKDLSQYLLLSWRKAYYYQPDSFLNPEDEFGKTLSDLSPEELSFAEERFLSTKNF